MDFKSQVEEVVQNGNCTGCGLCARLAASVTMQFDQDGFLRPVFEEDGLARLSPAQNLDVAQRFNAACPGRTVTAPSPPEGARIHQVFGPYIKVWQGAASDPEVRRRGSSGGVLTALTVLIAQTRPGVGVLASKQAPDDPLAAVSTVVDSRESALDHSGSRYQPISVLASHADDVPVVAKPCEIAANRQSGSRVSPQLSFFCAGTPSRLATEDLLRTLDVDPAALGTIRYRGDGWPGRFVAANRDGTELGATDYETSWGKYLGRDVQERCKICVDGTGEFADVAVGDFWETDERGYPVFSEREGNSVVIARTALGVQLVEEAMRAKVLDLESLDLESAVPVQPLQVNRRRTLAGRLLGRRLAGKRVPRYDGYGLVQIFVRSPIANLRTAVGSWRRARRR